MAARAEIRNCISISINTNIARAAIAILFTTMASIPPPSFHPSMQCKACLYVMEEQF